MAALVLAASLVCAQARAATVAAETFAGCYHLTLTRPLPARSVEFFVELSTMPSAEAHDAFVVRENRSSGFARIFRHARWSMDNAHALAILLSDGAESWSAALRGPPGRMTGTAAYSGDGDAPRRRWRALATRYACRR